MTSTPFDNPPSENFTRKTFLGLLGVYSSFALSLVIVVSIATWGVYVDFQETRASLLQSELNRLRSHATRTVLLIQDQLSSNPGDPLKSLDDAHWLHSHWNRSIPQDDTRLYAAIIDPQGRIVMHFKRSLEGNSIDLQQSLQPDLEAGIDVFKTEDPRLTGGELALDIAIPIVSGNREVASYHSGFDVRRFEKKLAQKSVATTRRWVGVFAVIVGVVLLAGISLYRLSRRFSTLQSTVALSRVRRMAELGQLAGGIAHEIRNPMNAIRLNLHVIQKLIDQHDSTRDHADDIVRETVLEMERIDGLLQALLNYARPERSHNESVAVGEEVRGVISFLQPIFDRNDVSIDASIADEPLIAHLDRARLRQIALNILKNALEAVGPGGVVHVKVDRQGSSVELVVADDGPGILAGDVSRIFEPFYTTKEMGTGLGMTLVKRYVEEAGGTIVYRPGEPRGAVFVVKLPMFGDVPTDEHSVPAPTVTA